MLWCYPKELKFVSTVTWLIEENFLVCLVVSSLLYIAFCSGIAEKKHFPHIHHEDKMFIFR